MVYRAIGIMSGSSLDGLDIVFASFEENRGAWSYEIMAAKPMNIAMTGKGGCTRLRI